MKVQASPMEQSRRSSPVPAAPSMVSEVPSVSTGSTADLGDLAEESAECTDHPVRVWKKEMLRILSPLPSMVAEYNRLRRERDREIVDAGLLLRKTFPEMRVDLVCPRCQDRFPNSQNLYRHLKGLRCKLQALQQWERDVYGAVEASSQSPVTVGAGGDNQENREAERLDPVDRRREEAPAEVPQDADEAEPPADQEKNK